jgi:hypothetical protein
MQNFILKYNGQTLEDEMTLAHYNIPDNGKLDIEGNLLATLYPRYVNPKDDPRASGLEVGRDTDMKVDLSTMVTRYIVSCTNQVLSMKGYVDSNTEFPPDFREKCEAMNMEAMQIIYDINELRGGQSAVAWLRDKYSSLALTQSDENQLRSVQNLVRYYLLEQKDIVTDSRYRMIDSAWKAYQKQNFLTNVEEHFRIYPDVRYPGHVAASPAGDPVTKALAELKCIWHEGSKHF